MPVDIASFGAVDERDGRSRCCRQRRSDLEYVHAVGIIGAVEGEDAGQACGGGEVIDACGEGLAAEVGAGKVVGGGEGGEGRVCGGGVELGLLGEAVRAVDRGGGAEARAGAKACHGGAGEDAEGSGNDGVACVGDSGGGEDAKLGGGA